MENSIVTQDLKSIHAAHIRWQQLYGKTVLITGAAGALPGYLVSSLLYLNDKLDDHQRCHVMALVRSDASKTMLLEKYGRRDDLTIVTQDVSLPFTSDRKLDFIIHAASQASPRYYSTDPVGTINANVLGTHNMLALARDHQVESFLFFSTSEVYGAAANPDAITETDFGAFDSATLRACYGESKRLGETLCMAWAHQFSVPAKIVRPFHTYGPGFRKDDGRVFADFVANIVDGRDIVINSDGTAVRAFCYIADATEAFFTVLLKGANATAYNVGNPDAAYSVKELAELLTGLFPEKCLKVVMNKPVSSGYIPSSINKNLPDITRLRGLGWHPRTDAASGFKRTVQSYINNT